MPLEVIASLFSRFYQAQQAASGKTKGTGLGLAICKGIVEAHGGRLEAKTIPIAAQHFISPFLSAERTRYERPGACRLYCG